MLPLLMSLGYYGHRLPNTCIVEIGGVCVCVSEKDDHTTAYLIHWFTGSLRGLGLRVRSKVERRATPPAEG